MSEAADEPIQPAAERRAGTERRSVCTAALLERETGSPLLIYCCSAVNLQLCPEESAMTISSMHGKVRSGLVSNVALKSAGLSGRIVSVSVRNGKVGGGWVSSD